MSGVTQTATYARLRSLFQGMMDDDSGRVAQAMYRGLSGREHDAEPDQVVLPLSTSLDQPSFSDDIDSGVDLLVSIDINSVHLDIDLIKPLDCDSDVVPAAMATVESELSQPSLARPDVGATKNALTIPLGPFEDNQDVNVVSASRPIRQQSKVAGDLVA